MSDQYTSAAYHPARLGRMTPGRLVHVEDRPGALAGIYFHPLHVRSWLLWDLNRLTRHHVGYGLWRQAGTREGRMQEPAQGLGIAVSRWEIVPAAAMPRRRAVMPVEEEGSCVWLIREGQCTRDLRDAMNAMLERMAGDGLWLQHWYDGRHLPPAPTRGPRHAPSAVPLSAQS